MAPMLPHSRSHDVELSRHRREDVRLKAHVPFLLSWLRVGSGAPISWLLAKDDLRFEVLSDAEPTELATDSRLLETAERGSGGAHDRVDHDAAGI
jgi:hypothetical protein